jgi:hypothetical protein
MSPSVILAMAVISLVTGLWMMWAYRRNEFHVTARLAAVISLTSTAYLCYQAYLGRVSVVLVMMIVTFALTMLSLAISRGRFHAPPR